MKKEYISHTSGKKPFCFINAKDEKSMCCIKLNKEYNTGLFKSPDVIKKTFDNVKGASVNELYSLVCFHLITLK